jgi:hypothetical protein
VGHLTATTVRVGAFVSGVRNSLGTFLANVVEPRQGKARRIYPLRAWMHEVRTDA